MEILTHMSRPDEVYALLKYKFGGCSSVKSQCDFARMSPDLKTCYNFLTKTSRSFAAVIQALDGELRDAVCIFYLVLRALDTVEDDMSIPEEKKVPMLKVFHRNLQDPNWCFMFSIEKDKMVLEQFPVISAEFRVLKPIYQQVIADICARMGEGMASYIDKSPHSMGDWDQYCHYVAGLVGIGLSQLFSASGLEAQIVGQDTRLSNSMGLFLQKTNIIRDYLEDVQQGRFFWPKEAWSKHADKLIDFSKPENKTKALHCLNELITNAMEHIPDVFTYLSRLKNQSVFNFCAIPQVMAIATLERCYNNPKVFDSVVKIRKGEAVKMIMGATSMESVKAIMKYFITRIQSRIPRNDPSAEDTALIVDCALDLSNTRREFVSSASFYPIYISFAMMVGAIAWQYWHCANTLSNKLAE